MKNRFSLQATGLMIAAVIMLIAAGQSHAQVNGQIVQKETGRRLSGSLRYRPASREYVITAEGRSLTVPLDQVQQVIVAKPAGIDAALQAVAAGRYSAAISTLETIRKDYQMLQWDVIATRALAEAYLKGMNDASRAIRMCEEIIRDNPQAAVSGDLAAIYWEALLADGREARLRSILTQAIQTGSRELAAIAQVKRGDIDMKNGDFRNALIDGYLRTVLLFQQVGSIQPEALYKAAKCFTEIGMTTHAEEMRKNLLQNYPQNEWAQKLRSGT